MEHALEYSRNEGIAQVKKLFGMRVCLWLNLGRSLFPTTQLGNARDDPGYQYGALSFFGLYDVSNKEYTRSDVRTTPTLIANHP